ncbi:MAG: PAS domain-containing protein, partial [Candidatus Binatia bacterium]
MSSGPKTTSVDDRLAAIPQLDTSRDEFRALLDAVPDALVIIEATDADGKGIYPFIAVNDDACQMFGYTREQLLERDLSDLWVDAEYGEHLRNRLLAGHTPRTSAELRRFDGTTVKVDVTTRVRALGDRLIVIATARERKDSTRLENELRRSRERLELSESFARAGSVDWDLVTGEERWSAGMYDILGVPRGSVEPCLETFRKYVHPEDRAATKVSIEQVGKSTEDLEGPIRMVLASGDERVFNVRMRGFTDWTGKIVRAYVTIQDITDQHAARTKIERVERRLAAAQKIAHVGSIEWDLRTGESWWSREFFRILGLDPHSDEPALRTYLDVVHEDDRPIVIERLREMQATGQGSSDDVRIRRPDGQERVINVTTIVVTDDDGKAVRQLTTIHDVTERKRMEEQLRNSETFLRKAQTVAGLGSWSANLTTGVVTWSEELYRICGVTPQTWDGRVESFLDDICLPEDRAAAESVWRLITTTGEAHQAEYRVRRPDGEVRHLLTRGQIVRDDDGGPQVVVGASQDITEIRLAQEALRVSEERLALATYGSSDGLWDWPDVHGDSLWVSPRYAELLGYTPDEFDFTAKTLTDAIHSDDRTHANAHWRAHFEHRSTFDLELRMRARDGEYRWFRMRGTALRNAAG